MTLINSVFDLLFTVIAPLPRSISLIFLAGLFGVLLVPIYGKVSPQRQIARAKKRIFAALFESVLFRRSSVLSLKAQAKMGLNGIVYFCLAIPPILILAIPCLLVLAQCNLYFGVRGISQDTPTMVIARLAEGRDVKNVRLSSEYNLDISAPVRDLQSREIAWRVVAPSRADISIDTPVIMKLDAGPESFSLPLDIGEKTHKIYPLNSQSIVDNMISPAGIRPPEWLLSLAVNYPERAISYAGITTHWMVVFLLVSIVSGYFASKVLGVEV